jgi:hypothetical protein
MFVMPREGVRIAANPPADCNDRRVPPSTDAFWPKIRNAIDAFRTAHRQVAASS